MSETAFTTQQQAPRPQIDVEFLLPDGTAPSAPTPPNPLSPQDWDRLDASIGRARLAAELQEGDLSVNDQALLLHDQIYGEENGIPSVDNFRAAQQFAGTVRFDANATTLNDSGEVVHGAYFSADGEQLAPDIAEDIMRAARPENWVQGESHRHLVARARDVLRTDGDYGANLPTLELANTVARLMADRPELVDADALQRLLDMDSEARRYLRQQRGGEELIAQAAGRNVYDIAMENPTPTNTGMARAEEYGIAWEGETPAQSTGLQYETSQASAAVDYQGHGHNIRYAVRLPENLNENTTLILIMNDSSVRSRRDVATVLYPDAMLNSNGRWGASRWGEVVRVGQTDVHGGLQNLTEEQRNRVDVVSSRLAVARQQEDMVPEEFRRRHPLPTHQQMAADLFPDVEKLTPEHWSVVRNSMERLRNIRLAQVRPDRTTPIALRWERIREATGNAWQTARSAAERLRPENIRNRIGAAVGATALTAAMVASNRPWARIMPAVREQLIPALRERLIPAVRERITNFDLREAARAVGVRLQLLASEAGSRLNGYLQQRLEAARNADHFDQARAAVITTAVITASAYAIREYLRYRHNIETGGTGHANNEILNNFGHGTDTNSVHHADTSSLTDSIPDKPKVSVAPKPTTVEIGTFDSSKRIFDYPKGTVGYRVLEHAHQSGVEITSRGQADRLIDATLKMDHMSWSDKVDVHQKIRLLDPAQMQDALRR